jgi:hypothetical protein
MARKTRVSFTREMMVAAAIKGLTTGLRQVASEFNAGFIRTESTMKANDPPRTASHEPAKKATTHGFLLNTARARRKKRRELNTTTVQYRIITSLSSLIHIGLGSTEEKIQKFWFVK